MACSWRPTQAILKFNLESLLWLSPFHTAKNRCDATCIRATVTPNRSLFGIPSDTSLKKTILFINVFSTLETMALLVRGGHLEYCVQLPF